MKHAKRSGWRPFWAALCAALLVLLPLVGGTVLLSRAQLRSSLRQAAKSQSGVPIRLPKAADRCTVLLCVADETPGFVLAYLNAGQNCIHLLAVPAALEVPFGGKNVPLADCYAAAGPARCREALGEVFALPEDTDYLAIAPAVLTKLAARYGAVRVGFTCSKKIGNAVARNRAKRRLRALAREMMPGVVRPGWDYVLVGRPGAPVSRNFAELRADLAAALARVHGK